MRRRIIKLNQRGVLAHAVPFAIVALVAIVGVGYLVYARAQSTSTPQIESGIVNESKGAWCMTSVGSPTGANTPVYSQPCSGVPAQQWTYNASAETIQDTAVTSAGTRCVGVENNNKAAGAYIVMNACNGTAAQKWSHTNAGRSFASALAPGNCIAIYGGTTGRQLRTNTCVATYYTQMWTLNSYTTTTPPPPPPPTTSTMDIISTLYAYPTLSSWTQVETASSAVKYAIVNICAPDGTGSGCGSPADEVNPDWKPTIQALENAGITPLYYISTNYGQEPLATVESELANAKSWYGLTDPMFDTTSTSNPSYYQSLYTYAVSIGANKVVYNPGTIPPQSYMFDGTTGTNEIIQVFEGTAAGFEGTSFPSWMSSYPAGDFAATMSAGTSATVGTDVNDAANDHIGNFYEDDEAEPPNYATLPAFWSTEVTDVTNAK